MDLKVISKIKFRILVERAKQPKCFNKKKNHKIAGIS